jgi:hypothetical protein
MATTTQRSDRRATPPPAKVEDNTLDEHAGLSDLTFPVTDNDQSSEGGQSHVATHEDRQGRVARAACLRAAEEEE